MRCNVPILLFVSVCLTLDSIAQGMETTSDCKIYCHVENVTLYHANCSYRNLSKLPDLPENITADLVSLDLVGNRFINLTGVSWEKFRSLYKLSLAKNNIDVLEDGDFANLSRLEVLDLSLNQIRYNRINKGVFKPLARLKYLDLKQNLRDISENETYPDALKYSTQLQTLLIDGLDSHILPDLPQLTELYLSGEYGRCNITSLNQSYFSNVSNTQHLYMSNCSIRNVSEDTFVSMWNLSSLDLARNTQMGTESVPNITYGLGVTKKIKRLNLNSLYDYIDYDLCSSLDVEDIKYLTNTSLELLTIEKNYMVRMEEAAVDYFPPSLKYVSASDNMFMYGKYVVRLINRTAMHNLVYFDTSKMYKTHIPVAITLPSRIRQFDTTFLTAKTSNITCLDHENFTKLAESMLTRTHIIDDFEEILEKMRKNGIGLANESTQNEVTHQQEYLTRQSKLEYLDLSENLPGTIKMTLEIFKNTPNISFLNASNNYLGYPLLDETSNKIFESVNNLRILDLGNNRITKLMPNIFDNLTKLEKLYLSNNRLSVVSFNLAALTALTYLDLSDNRLEKLETSTRDALDQLVNIKVNMANNTLMCTCKNINFVMWVHVNDGKFENLEKTNCNFYNSTPTFFSKINFEQFKYECSPPKYHTIILVVSLCILTFLITMSCGLVYRFKWNLRYLYYMTKFKLVEGYQPMNDREYEKEVFVSYSNDDRGFVREHLVRELETKGNISLLVHDRDFRAGEFVADNIMRAITSTRRTLVILTTAYIQSKWCMYEMNMARMEAADTGRNVLCVLLKEDIPTKYLPIEVMNIIKKKTYMEFPTEDEHMNLFWERLRVTLNHEV